MNDLKNKKPKSFILYVDMVGCFENLTGDECKELVLGIFHYHDKGQFETSNRVVQISFDQMKPHFDRNAAKYMATCEKKRAWRETNASKAKKVMKIHLKSTSHGKTLHII